MKPDFTKKLILWNKRLNKRLMPWKNEKDPYRIWLSEIILQQTRVEQGWAYYEKFIRTFPTIRDLAKAPEQKVFKLWQGLGYYSRCRNLIETAKKITKDFKGKFPSNYETINALKGVGPYTAAAIASFAFNLPYPVVDGNVHRVLSRYFGISTPFKTALEKKFYNQLAFMLLDQKQPGIYNQAIMDFGATVCKPRQPLCKTCVQSSDCLAFQKGWVEQLPVAKEKLQRKTRWFYYLIVEKNDNELYIRRRTGKDIWEDLYEFVLFESKRAFEENVMTIPTRLLGQSKFTIVSVSAIYKQQLTHQTIFGQFIRIRMSKITPALKNYELVSKKLLKTYPFPRMISSFLEDPNIVLF
jgi:A/G-specific adenine glycosylase